jgi:hypothetical protein
MADMSTATGFETPGRRRRAGQVWWTLAVIAWAALFVLAYEAASHRERSRSSPPALAVGTPLTAAAPHVTGPPRILGLTRLPTPPALKSALTSSGVGSASTTGSVSGAASGSAAGSASGAASGSAAGSAFGAAGTPAAGGPTETGATQLSPVTGSTGPTSVSGR